MTSKNYFILMAAFLLTFASCRSDFEKNVRKSISEQMERYPKSTLQDIYKNFFQDYFGPEHAIADTASARRYLKAELDAFDDSENSMVEALGYRHNFVRINLAAVKEGIISEDDLFYAFIESADFEADEHWAETWNGIVEVVKKMQLPIAGFDDDERRIDSLLQQHPNMALHHSAVFRENYAPHYRIVKRTLYEERLERYFENVLE